ncbi:ATP-binding protein, partial [Francisella tularensis subsp. holarctica]|nr:ATP-binding protein [Francisella tularensis subsp. holarctica]
PSLSAFSLDPEIQRETIWAGDVYKAPSVLVDRTGPLVKVIDRRKWEVIEQYTPDFESIFTQSGIYR